MSKLPTKTEQVTVDRTTATCALCGREAVVVEKYQGDLADGAKCLEAGRDPLDPNTEPAMVDTKYGHTPTWYCLRDVFVERFDQPETFTKQSLLVCNGCSDDNRNPLLTLMAAARKDAEVVAR